MNSIVTSLLIILTVMFIRPCDSRKIHLTHQQLQQTSNEQKIESVQEQIIQKWPKSGPDIPREQATGSANKPAAAVEPKVKSNTAYESASSRGNGQEADPDPGPGPGRGSNFGAKPDERIKRERIDADPFITVSDDVQTHLSATNQLQKVNKLRPTKQIQAAGKVKQLLDRDTAPFLAEELNPLIPGDPVQVTSWRGKDNESPSGGIHNEALLNELARSKAGKLIDPDATYARRQQALVGQARGADDEFSQLYLDTGSMPLEVAAHIGQTASLVCRLRSIHQQQQQSPIQRDRVSTSGGGLQVSWRRNLQILTSGLLRFTSDERFQVTHVSGFNDWVLEIHNVQPSDEGPYECQVNSEPKPASVSLYLRIMQASIEIVETSTTGVGKKQQLQVEEGDQIRLTCRVQFHSASSAVIGDLDEPSDDQAMELVDQELDQHKRQATGSPLTSQHYIFWYKDGASLEYNNPRGGIKVERLNRAYSMEKVLLIEGASSESDGGSYMCKIQPELNEVKPAIVQVIVGGSSRSNATGVRFEVGLISLLLPLMVMILAASFVFKGAQSAALSH